MMAEIMKRGPISCRQAVTKAFFAYKGGIFKDTTGDTRPRHATSILGWGKSANGEKYWIGRNSWGTYWGENGYFKILKGENQYGIEEECSWGVPTHSGVIAKNQEMLMGRDDSLVTNQDLGASIDGAESLVQDDAGSDDTRDDDEPAKRSHREPRMVKPLEPAPVVTADDDHSDNFFNSEIKSDDKNTQHVKPMLADADPAFQRQQKKAGVQA